MLLPKQMTRVLIVGSRGALKDTIEVLYQLEAAHLIDFSAEEEGFSLGAPLPESSDASQKLLKLRSLEKDMGLDEMDVSGSMGVAQVEKDLASSIADLEAEITGATESKNQLQNRVSEMEAERAVLTSFLGIPLDLEMYHDYDSLRVFTGKVRGDPTTAVKEAAPDCEVFLSESGDFVAAFVSLKQAEAAQKALIQFGYTEVPAPIGSGSPQQMKAKVEEELTVLGSSMAEAVKKLEDLKDKHAVFVKAADEHLSIIVEKAETPLRVGTTPYTFAMDAWVATEDMPRVEKEIGDKLAGKVHIESLETISRRESHGHDGDHQEQEEEAPTQIQNGKHVGRFEYLLRLLSMPKYREIDPTITMMITLPIFFGLMVGDIGYGIPFMVLGYIGLKKCASADWKMISTLLLYGGAWATLFGIFMFGEAYGLHFSEQAHDMSWSSLLGISLPHQIAIGGFEIPLGIYSKLHNVQQILYMSLWIGIAHLFIGMCIGFYNKTIRYGLKHAILEKAGWIMILIGGAVMLLFLIDAMIRGLDVGITDIRMLIAIPLIVVGILVAYKGEGANAILELPGLMGNVISYTRLAAIGMSKAGLALAFNTIAFKVMWGHDFEISGSNGGEPIMLIAALGVFLIGHLTIFILAIISAGLHSLRLHYVEFFMKFYEGGGVEFKPLKVIRKYTTDKNGVSE